MKINPELAEEGLHVLGVVVGARGEEEDPELALGELGPGGEDVRQQEGEAAVVVEPVDVYEPLLWSLVPKLLISL